MAGDGDLGGAEATHIAALEDCNATALLQDATAVPAMRYFSLVLHVLLAALRGVEPAAALARFPESTLRDALNYAAFAVNYGAMDLLGSVKQVRVLKAGRRGKAGARSGSRRR